MLWLIFILGLNCIFICFKLISITIYPKTKENQVQTKDKLNQKCQSVEDCIIIQITFSIVYYRSRDTTCMSIIYYLIIYGP